ncbi:MAG: hypothetical protein ACKVQJ_14650 [Pyrinomonadaceae bacterium]
MSKNTDFATRFIDACGTSEPAKIQRLLNISYQSAKNYLEGRLPHPDILIIISSITSCSIDWLLTGHGKKIVDSVPFIDTPVPAGQMEAFVRRICVEVINEMNGSQETAQPKIVVLQPSDIMSEKVTDNAIALTGRQP